MIKYYNDNILIFIRNLKSSQDRLNTILESGNSGNAAVDLAVANARISALELQVANLSVPQVIDSLVSSSTTNALSANQGRLLKEQKLSSGNINGTKLELQFADASKIQVDVTTLLADVKLQSGTYNSTTKAIDFKIGDGATTETVSVPATELLKIQTATHFTGDGTTNAPLTLPLSTDAGNQLKFGTDFKLYVGASGGGAVAVKTLPSLPAQIWTALPASGFTKDNSFRLFNSDRDITEAVAVRRAGTSFELLSLSTLSNLSVEIQGN